MTKLSPSGWVDISGRNAKILEKHPGSCTWCGVTVKKPRRTWCSDDCVQEFTRRSQAAIRSAVDRRDKGVCSLCSLDTRRLVCIVQRAGPLFSARSRRVWGLLGLDVPPCGRKWSPWDADHVVAISEGGDPHDLDNLRTLCWWCHRAMTSALHRRRKKNVKLLLTKNYLDAAVQFLDEASEGWVHGSRMRDLLIELYPGWNAGGSDDDVLRELVEAGKLVHTVKPEPNPSQRAFLGLQFTRKSFRDLGFEPGIRACFSFRAADSFVVTEAMRAHCRRA